MIRLTHIIVPPIRLQGLAQASAGEESVEGAPQSKYLWLLGGVCLAALVGVALHGRRAKARSNPGKETREAGRLFEQEYGEPFTQEGLREWQALVAHGSLKKRPITHDEYEREVRRLVRLKYGRKSPYAALSAHWLTAGYGIFRPKSFAFSVLPRYMRYVNEMGVSGITSYGRVQLGSREISWTDRDDLLFPDLLLRLMLQGYPPWASAVILRRGLEQEFTRGGKVRPFSRETESALIAYSRDSAWLLWRKTRKKSPLSVRLASVLGRLPAEMQLIAVTVCRKPELATDHYYLKRENIDWECLAEKWRQYNNAKPQLRAALWSEWVLDNEDLGVEEVRKIAGRAMSRAERTTHEQLEDWIAPEMPGLPYYLAAQLRLGKKPEELAEGELTRQQATEWLRYIIEDRRMVRRPWKFAHYISPRDWVVQEYLRGPVWRKCEEADRASTYRGVTEVLREMWIRWAADGKSAKNMIMLSDWIGRQCNEPERSSLIKERTAMGPDREVFKWFWLDQIEHAEPVDFVRGSKTGAKAIVEAIIERLKLKSRAHLETCTKPLAPPPDFKYPPGVRLLNTGAELVADSVKHARPGWERGTCQWTYAPLIAKGEQAIIALDTPEGFSSARIRLRDRAIMEHRTRNLAPPRANEELLAEFARLNSLHWVAFSNRKKTSGQAWADVRAPPRFCVRLHGSQLPRVRDAGRRQPCGVAQTHALKNPTQKMRQV